MTYTRYAISGLPSAGRKISPPGRDLFRSVSVSPPRRTDSTPSAAGGRTESSAPTAGRRTPRAFVPLRSTAGRRPLHALSLRGAKRRGNPFSFLGRIPTPVCSGAHGPRPTGCSGYAGRTESPAPTKGCSHLRRDVVPQGHLFRCAPLQYAVPYGITRGRARGRTGNNNTVKKGREKGI